MTENHKKRDIILICSLFVVVGALFLIIRMFAFQSDATHAYVFYGTSSQPIVSINFEGRKITTNYLQENTGDERYPIIDLDENTITLLGDYQINGVRQILVIRFDFDKRSVKIIEEQSPNNICSREGESTGWPLICIPNRIRVEFDNRDEDFII